ncbi:sterol desaturase-related protein [Thioalkalivibrio sulfidiphilus HL-EbGr7]|uniref:Sterol desaturase-related protein n=1 Tax=Thioalkalivibrio sulfidiphilus (strain HL-EbGR7) TaxID=396588 RepID=B8GT26_THISH|nr:sterol desaturase family protein [Thioalkalivibrio sulfidiphilus]ACL73041.1 sterol desaturase-related protein [Thioalkalivibrio sulfidiphilus HL-EbGr7]
MTEWITANEAALRLGFFLGILLLLGIAEALLPRRQRLLTRLQRWTSNLGIVVINTVLLRLLFPAAAVGMAVFAQSTGWGVFNTFELPFWIAVLVSVLVLDFMIWLQHVMVHAVPALWRLHRVHHADLDFDVTTGLRFHPLEIILSMGIKFAVITVLGPPVLAVILFEILLNATSMFNHSNLRLPLGLDRVLRLFVVTPDMHRVHHSVADDETNSNFGFNLPWWDRLFGTYKAQPREGHEGMTIGIDTFRDPRQCDGLKGMLLMPFVGKVTDYAINRRQWEKKP